MEAFKGRGGALLARASLLFDRHGHAVVAFGHENHKVASQVTTHDTLARQQIQKSMVKVFVPTGGSQAAALVKSPWRRSQTVYLAGQSGSQAAVAAISLSRSRPVEPAIIKISSASKVSHLFIDISDGHQLFGTTLSRQNNVELYSMRLTKVGSVQEGSLKVTSLSQAVGVSSVLPHLKDGKMHLMISTADASLVYIVYDLNQSLIHHAIPLTAPKGPLMSLLTQVDPTKVQATFVVPKTEASDSYGLF